MFYVTFLQSILFLYVVTISSLAGAFLSCLVPWSEKAEKVGVPLAFGLGVGPLLLGLLVIVNLIFFSGFAHSVQLILVFCYLHIFAMLFFVYRSKINFASPLVDSISKIEVFLFAFLLIWCVALIIDSGYLPLTQNDALEYATVGREIFITNAYTSYPVINSAVTKSGLYGPWTHPPLYPALIYFSYLLQGHAKFPGLMRFLAPWALLVSTYIIYILGCFRNRKVGLISALLFVSTPLLFLGAESGLIDAFPVLGFLLVFTLICSIEDFTLIPSIIIGTVLGVSLWTHSVAILFPPLIIALLVVKLFNRCTLFSFIKYALLCLFCAMVVAFYPYYQNIHNFHALISDTPVVFALKSLDWSSYFSIARGISSIFDKVQYGLLKGFFAPEAYAADFWLLLLSGSLSLCFYIARRPKSINLLTTVNRTLFRGFDGSLFVLSAVLLVCFFCGVALTIVLDIDLLIRNERYFLIIIPFVCLLTAVFFDYIFSCYRQKVERYSMFLFVSMLISQLLLFSTYRLYTYNQFDFTDSEDGIYKRSEYQAMRYLQNKTPKSSLVFSLKPADMYYSHRKMISYLDPRLVAFYKESRTHEAFIELTKLEVDYIHLPPYYLPPVYNSQLQQLAANPIYTQLVFSKFGSQIYKLNRPMSTKVEWESYLDLSPELKSWGIISKWSIGGRKDLFSILSGKRTMRGSLSDNSNTSRLFSRSKSTMIFLGGKNNVEVPVKPSAEYLLQIKLSGIGLVNISVQQFKQNTRRLVTRGLSSISSPLGDLVLTSKEANVIFSRRFKSSANSSHLRIMIAQKGNGLVHLKSVRLSTIKNSK